MLRRVGQVVRPVWASDILSRMGKRPHAGYARTGGLAFAATALLAGPLAVRADPALDWTEDVRLPGGRITSLKRHMEFNGPHELRQRSTSSGQWLEFINPANGQKVRWEGDRTQETAALLISDGAPWLLVHLTFNGWRFNFCPHPPFLLFKYEDGTWTRKPVEAIPLKKLRANLSSYIDRDAIAARKYYLPAEVTADSSYDRRPWWISFEGLDRQTYDCRRPLGQEAEFGVPPEKRATEETKGESTRP